MSNITILKEIILTSEGPKVKHPNNELQRLHLRQGDLDGACGIYCLVMSLMVTTDKICRDSIECLNHIDGRTYAGKLIKLLENQRENAISKAGLFREGLDYAQLSSFIEGSFRGLVTCENHVNNSNMEVTKFVIAQLKLGNPVILGIIGPNLNHWVLGIGYEHSDSRTEKIFALDPGNANPILSPWNVLFELNSNKGRYPHNYLTIDMPSKVQFSEAFAIVRKNR